MTKNIPATMKVEAMKGMTVSIAIDWMAVASYCTR